MPESMQSPKPNTTQQAKRRNVELSPEKEINLVGSMKITELMSVIKDAINNSLDEKLINLATKSDIDDIKNDIGVVNNDVAALRKENIQLKKEIDNLKREKIEDRKNLIWLNNQICNKKLIFKGLTKENNCLSAIRKTCKDKLKVDANIVTAKKIFERNGKMSVAVEFESTADISNIFKNTKKLSGSTIHVERDLMPLKQEKKKIFLRMKKSLLELSKKHKVMVRDDKLKVDDKWFIWDSDNKLICDKEDGSKILEDLYGEEVKSLDLSYEKFLENMGSKN